MSRALNLLFAAALLAAALAAAVNLASLGATGADKDARLCAERLCGVVFF